MSSRERARPEDPQPARRDRQDHVDGHLRLRPAPLRRLHPDHGEGRHPRPRVHGRGRRGRPGGEEPQEVGDRVVVPFTIACGNCCRAARQLCSLCDNSNPNAWMAEKLFGHSACRPLRLLAHDRRLRRRPGRVRARAVRRRRPAQGPRRPARREGAVPLRHLPDRLHGRRERATSSRATSSPSGAAAPVGQFAIKSAYLLGAERVIAIDRFAVPAAHGARAGQAPRRSTTRRSDVYEALQEMTGGRGPDALHRRRRHGGARARRHRRPTTAPSRR